MKFAMIGAVLITLPALVALVYGIVVQNWVLVFAALASVSLNTLPFIAAGFFMRRTNSEDMGH